CDKTDLCGRDWHHHEPFVVYIDGFGNVMTGLRAGNLDNDARLIVRGHKLSFARTFSDRPKGHLFWYENANGLVEIAENCGSAANRLKLTVGDAFEYERGTEQVNEQ
ncbi:MAG: SAM hydroxide adenosyltransferase, partial [Kiloniellales bacterium]|nr:SAM hydroxide adenosyltransferase [Kiloniellales bacterium]